MAYSSTGVNVILQSWGKFRATAGEDVTIGSLIDQDFKDADAVFGENPAKYIACDDIASGNVGSFCKEAVVRKPSTIATGGIVTRGDHNGTNGDVLFLSTTAGTAVEVVDGDGIGQQVGRVLSQDTVLLDPSPFWDEDMEKETSSKLITADTDVGKAFYVTGTDDVVVTIPAIATGQVYKVVNGAQDGDHMTSLSPQSDDMIVGPDYSGTNNEDWQNTKETSRCGDYLVIAYESGDGYIVTDIKGTWTQA